MLVCLHLQLKIEIIDIFFPVWREQITQGLCENRAVFSSQWMHFPWQVQKYYSPGSSYCLCFYTIQDRACSMKGFIHLVTFSLSVSDVLLHNL